jgi:hypothetical protein
MKVRELIELLSHHDGDLEATAMDGEEMEQMPITGIIHVGDRIEMQTEDADEVDAEVEQA